MQEISIEGDSIRLGQFLKLIGVMETGGEAKARIAGGEILINGEVEVRRGRQLRRGDVVTVAGEQFRVT